MDILDAIGNSELHRRVLRRPRVPSLPGGDHDRLGRKAHPVVRKVRPYRLLHLGFVVFAVAGAFLILRWPRTAWVHLPAALWGVLVEWSGWVCPLTPLENRLRA